MGWLTWCFQLVCLQLVVLHSVTSANLCSFDQSSALLHFKQLFSFDNYASSSCSGWQTSYPKMKHWKEDSDCCSWDGVTCDLVTGHVIGLDLSCSWLHGTIPPNSSLFLLPHLQNLNLAFNDFGGSPIPSDFIQLKSLTHLNLSCSSFSGLVPLEISHLSKLVSLDLSAMIRRYMPSYRYFSLGSMYSYFSKLRLETSVMKGLVQNLTDLGELVLNGVNMSTIDPAYLTNLSSSLTLLNLQKCSLQGMFPENIFHLPNLQEVNLQRNDALTAYLDEVNWTSTLKYLDLSFSNSLGKLPSSIGNLNSLWHLDLSYCNFMGTIPMSIGNLSQLQYLHLSNNNFSGHIPSSLSNLEQLSILDLSNNHLSGQIPTNFGIRLQNLVYINLNNNSLAGPIPSRLFTLPFLVSVGLSSNQLTGNIPEFQKTALATIDLSNNRLHGPILHSIVELVNLTSVYLSSNNLSGAVELSMFAKLKNLEELHLSDNILSLLTTTNEVNFSFPLLFDLSLSSCNINQFPNILSTANNLLSLDLSNNKIHGQIPNWLYETSALYYLNLSHNYLTGIQRLPWLNLYFLDLHSNLLQGLLPSPPPDLEFFSVSHNNMTGVIPSSICNLTSVEYIDLSNNSLYGSVPLCLGNSTSIKVLDLRMNSFHGSIPQTFVNDSGLITLNLNGNKLEGPLPPSLVNCRRLEVLDVGNNMINDTFPHWLANLPELQVLILRSNRFHGSLDNPKTRLPFLKLRILDLSQNSFVGPLQARFFQNFEAMMSWGKNGVKLSYMGDYYYKDSIMVVMKGVDIRFERILTIFTAMDLSNNKFQGQVLETIGKLNALKVLNFSHNNLTGHIPVLLKNLTELESLDLSSNKLEGEIPIQLTSLTSLSTLNLSYNQLEGRIPQGNQFNTFDKNTYEGNLGLCGSPLSKNCSDEEAPKLDPTKFPEEDTPSWVDWKIILMGYGSGLVIGLSMGYIAFSTGKPWWLVSKVEQKALKLSERHKKGRRRRRRN